MSDRRLNPKAPTLSARQRLEQWIRRGRLTQAEAAELIGCSRVQLNQYLMGVKCPGLEMAIRIWDVTGISARAWVEVNRFADANTESNGKPVAIQ